MWNIDFLSASTETDADLLRKPMSVEVMKHCNLKMVEQIPAIQNSLSTCSMVWKSDFYIS